jgi:two-component sensor histidine kinase
MGGTRIFSWPRLRLIAGFSILAGLLPDLLFNGGEPLMLVRVTALGVAGLLAFGAVEVWPRRLPRWLARWVLQVLGVALTMPVVTAALWVASTAPGAPAFWQDNDRLVGFGFMVALSMLVAPWTALAALLRQKEAFARSQALAFDLERSELARQAADARLHLLAAQVAPHFLFNTLANVQALVDAQSPRAADVLRSLTAYLRAAVPRLHDRATTLGQEVELVQAYLELMHMRMPDRLAFALDVDEAARPLPCPPMTLLTLVENAVRHGIDPNEDGGRIDVSVQRRGARCFVRVADTGVGFQEGTGGLGTGLSTLRERLEMSFAGDARLQLSEQAPHGVCAELDFPA